MEINEYEIMFYLMDFLDVHGAKSLQECVSKFIKEEHREHVNGTSKKKMTKKQVVAAAYSYCRKKGFKDCALCQPVLDTLKMEDSVAKIIEPIKLSKAQRIEGGLIKVPVILAKEMVQNYAIHEFPSWIQEVLKDAGMSVVPVLKPFDEIKKIALNANEVPVIINHSAWRPDRYHSVGSVKDITCDPSDRSLKGMGYLIEAKLDKNLVERILDGEIVDVSIGGSTAYRMPRTKNAKHVLEQCDIDLDHLAILPDDPGRCPAGTCGLNMDSRAGNTYMSKEFDLVSELARLHDRPVILSFSPGPSQRTSVSDQKVTKVKPNNASSIYYYRDGTMTESHEEIIKKLQAELGQKDAELASLRDSAVKDLEKKHKDLQIKNETLTKANEMKDKEITDLKAKVEDADKKQKAADEEEKKAIISALVDAKYDTEENLTKQCLHDLRIRFSTLEGAKLIKVSDAESKIRRTGFPKPPQGEREKNQKKMEDKDKGKGKALAAVIDVNTLFSKKGE